MAAGDDDHAVGGDTLPSWNIVVICTVGGVLMLEFLCHQMNAAAKGKKHAMELLEGLYRELAILGVVAFVLWSISVSEYVTIEYNDEHLFEQIHMTLFLAALFHSFPIGMVVLYSRQTIRRWDMFEDDEMRRYKDLKQQYRRTAAQLGIKHSQVKRGVGVVKWAYMWTSHPMLCRRLSELSEHVSYHALRSQFIKDNNLPKNFRFAAYLKKCEQEVVIGLGEIKHGVWVGLILFVGVELYIKGLMGKAKSNADGRGLFLLAATLVILAALAVHFKLKQIYSALVDTYRPSTEKRNDMAQYLGPNASAEISQQEMFWFSKPQLMLTALQTIQFVLAVMVSSLIWFGAGESKGLVIGAEMLLALGAFAVYIIVLPKFIPRFTQVTHIGGMVNRSILSETILKQKNAFQRRALPPTLRQVSVMARLKSNEAMEHGRFIGIRRIMSGETFRECVKVMVAVHFFVIANNTDLVNQNNGDGGSLVTEIVLAAIALLIEITTHVIVWRGEACFHINPFVEVPTRPVNAPNKPAATVYPSNSRRQLLEHDSNASPTEPGGHNQDGSSSTTAASTRKETHRVCSFWACFGSRGGDYSTAGVGGCCGCLDGVPAQSVVGAWRSLDLVLVLVVLGCAMTTGLMDGLARVVTHAIQGIVVLRLWPLWRCPFPPAVGHEYIRNVDGATLQQAPLDKNTLETVMQETLTMLRRQNPHEGTFKARALMAEPSDAGMADGHHVRRQDCPSAKRGNGGDGRMPSTVKEEKNEDEDSDHEETGSADGIANVGVAMALRQACTANPDLVQSHGPLSVPILRAMLGLDPLKARQHDDAKAFAVAARVSTFADGLSHTEEPPSPAGSVAGTGADRRGRSSSWEVPPRPALSSPSSSDLSDGDTNEGAGSGVMGTSRHEGRKKGRLSSFLSGGGRSRNQHYQHHHHRPSLQHQSHQHRNHHQQQQQLLYQQQQQLLYQQQVQVQIMQQQQMKELQYQRYQLGHHGESASRETATTYHEHPRTTDNPTQGTSWAPSSDYRGEYMASRSMMGAPQPWIDAMPLERFDGILRHGSFDSFTPADAPIGSGNSSRRGTLTRSSNSRPQRRAPNDLHPSNPIAGIVPAAFEDLERAVFPASSINAGPQHATISGRDRGGRGPPGNTGEGRSGALGGGRVSYSSGRSVPYSSDHHSARRGTPTLALFGPPRSRTEPHPAASDGKRAVPLRFQSVIEGGSDGDGRDSLDGHGYDASCGVGGVGRGGGPVNSDGNSANGGDSSSRTSGRGGIEEFVREAATSDATASGSGASATAENSTTPSAYLAGMDAFVHKGTNAE